MARTSCPVWLAPRLLRPIKDYTSARCSYRAFTSSGANHAEAVESQESGSAQAPLLDPNLVSTHFEERQLVRDQHQNPIGSRRRRALAKLYPDSLPFEQLPYQCFQEARKILAADREAKLKQIGEMRARIARSQEIPSEALGGDYVKKGKLIRMQKHLEELKILADINDPLVKKKFEDGQGRYHFSLFAICIPRSFADSTDSQEIWTDLYTAILRTRNGANTNATSFWNVFRPFTLSPTSSHIWIRPWTSI